MAAPKGNRFAVGNTGGRPPKFTNAKDLQDKIDEYFEWINGEYELQDYKNTNEATGEETTKQINVCVRQPERPTITGLALFLGFENKVSMYDYKKRKVFSYPIKRALSVIENNYEQALFGKTPAGAIFALKNMEWADKKEVDLTMKEYEVNFGDER